jgi:hypothetical protein
MKKATLVVYAVAFLVAVPALADVTVFLDHSTADCPLYQNGPMTGDWYTNQCNPQGHHSSFTPPSSYLCADAEDAWHEVCVKLPVPCCTYVYYTDNDSRTMTNSCSSFTSPQTYTH